LLPIVPDGTARDVEESAARRQERRVKRKRLKETSPFRAFSYRARQLAEKIAAGRRPGRPSPGHPLAIANDGKDYRVTGIRWAVDRAPSVPVALTRLHDRQICLRKKGFDVSSAPGGGGSGGDAGVCNGMQVEEIASGSLRKFKN
jgi:hypothetical protein